MCLFLRQWKPNILLANHLRSLLITSRTILVDKLSIDSLKTPRRAFQATKGQHSRELGIASAMRQHNTQRCSDELFAFLQTGNERRFANVLGSPRYPWHDWFCDILCGRNHSISPGADLSDKLLAHPQLHGRLAAHFRLAASECSFLGTAPGAWSAWQFLEPHGARAFHLPTWLLVGSSNGDASGQCIRLGIHVRFGQHPSRLAGLVSSFRTGCNSCPPWLGGRHPLLSP